MELTDPGFDFSILSEFRTRLIDGAAELNLLDALLTACKARGYLKLRGRQRTDSTHVLGVLRALNRLERAAETLRAALNAVATEAPDWLRAITPPDWFDRYSRRVEDSRLPRGNEARQAYAILVGADGMRLLEAIDGPAAPAALLLLPAVEVLRRTWAQQYVVLAGVLQLREPKNMPPASAQVESPYELEARYGTRRDRSWIGYKVHVSESCDDDRPHLLTHVETTIAPATDVEQLAAVHDGLAERDLLPGEHLVDAGYVRGPNLVASQRAHRIDLIGPSYEDHQWQAKAKQGFDVAHFQVDWDARRVTCPQGKVSVRWSETETARGRIMVAVGFAAADCSACPTRALCTRAKTGARNLTLQPRAEHEAIQAAPASGNDRVRRPLCAASRHRGDALARHPSVRPAPGPLSRPGQDPLTARRHRNRHQRRAPRRLAERSATRDNPKLSLRRPRTHRLIITDRAGHFANGIFRGLYPSG